MSTTMPVGAGALLTHRSFLLFLLSRSLSRFSSLIAIVAFGWQVYDLTGSAFALGMMGLAGFLPTALLVFVAGNVADRYERKRILKACQFAEALTALLLAWGAYAGWLNVVDIFIAVLVLGTTAAFENPATAALLPLVVPEGAVQRATALSSGSAQLATITGPALGGIAYAVSPGLPYAMMVVFWLIAAICAGAVQLTQPAAPKGAATPKGSATRKGSATSGDLFAGVNFIRNHPAILGTLSLDLFAVLFGGVVALLPIYARDILQTGPWGLGVLRAAPALGALLTTVVLARQPIARRVGMRMFQCHHLRRRHGGVLAVALDVAVGRGAGGAGRGRYGQRGDPLLAGATRHPERDARPGRCGELPVHQRLQQSRPVRKRRHRRLVGHDAGRRIGRRRHGRDRAVVDEAVSDAAGCRAAGVAFSYLAPLAGRGRRAKRVG